MKKFKPDRYLDAPRCKFYIPRKNRKCKLVVGKSGEYCAEHEVALYGKTDSRVEDVNRMPCPYDGTHSVNIQKLESHLKICNARPKDDLPSYIQKGINAAPEEEDAAKKEKKSGTRLYDMDVEKVKSVIQKIHHFYRDNEVGEMPKESIQTDATLEEEMKNPIYGPETKKHLKQISSLIGHMRISNLLQNETAYLDFGSGKGINVLFGSIYLLL